MNKFKKWLAVLFTAVIIIGSALPSAQAATSSDLPEATDRIAQLMLTYPIGSYFTKNGGPCECHSLDQCLINGDNCNCRKYLGAVQCFGFAKYVFYNMFGIDVGTYQGGYVLSNTSELVSTPLSAAQVSEQSVKDMLSYAKIGDFIQGKSRYSQHSIIIAGLTDGGIVTYECNTDGHCGVTSRTLSYAYLASTYYNGISLNSAKNYPYASGGEPFDSTDPANYPVPTRMLYKTSPNMTGSDVMWLQAALNRLGYSLTLDGIFGSGTDAAVRDYQSKNGLDVDGYVGPGTRQSIIDALAALNKVTVGDIDANGIIDGSDLLMLTQHFLGFAQLTKRQLAAADIDSNGAVESIDCLALQQHMLGIKAISQPQ